MKCEVLVDWLTFSIKTEDPDEVIIDYLEMDPDLFQEAPGFNGYEKSKRFNSMIRASQVQNKSSFVEERTLKTEYIAENTQNLGNIRVSSLPLSLIEGHLSRLRRAL